ncbi:MAG: hypothetical protein ACLQVL_05795 [Terriglobia bacterium]
MMIRLIAAAFEDGWAFVQKDGQTILIRPPYRSANALMVPDSAVEAAAHAYGFQVSDESFADWADLVAYLNKKLVDLRKASKLFVDDPNATLELLRRAPKHILDRYIDRVEGELIPAREFKAAANLLAHLMDLENIRSDAAVYHRVARLLAVSTEGLLQREPPTLEWEEHDLSQRCPGAVQRYGAASIRECSERVRQRRQVFAFGSA